MEMNIFFQFKSMNSFEVCCIFDSTQSGSTMNLIKLLDLISLDGGHDEK